MTMEAFVDEIQQQIKRYLSDGMKMFISSSFQTHSVPMLHIISEVDASIPVYFLNTGYHFPRNDSVQKSDIKFVRSPN